ncbi:hypothetical protein B1A99_24945 [Cohnella sp. CIP 111063]|nr:hypothetical protein B1A99_24945 [Cohnella sp. CIP 111063]
MNGGAGMTNIGRNDPCPCGSGKKFKHCHIGESVHTEPSLQEIQLMRDTTLENLLAQIEIYDNEGMLNHFPNHQTLIRELRSAVKAAAQVDIVRNPSHIPGKQIYNREHLGRLGKIVFAWSIPAVEHLIEVNNLQTQNFYVADLNKFVNSSALKQKN